MKKLLNFKLILLLCVGFCFGMGANISAQDVYSAEADMFMLQWQQYKQKSNTEAPSLEQLQDDYGLINTAPSSSKAEEWVLPIFISVKSQEELEDVLLKAEKFGFKIQTRLKTICTGLIPANNIRYLGEIEGVLQIQTVRKANLKMDKARKATKVDSVQMGVLKDKAEKKVLYRGKGVVVGIVDIGFDYTHPNFYDPDTTSIYRVKRVWDQTKINGTHPTGYDYGTEYNTESSILAAKRSTTDESHASHVSGIAAGSGASTSYMGMAPKADLVFVSTNMNENGILDGVKYIKDYAKSNNRPAVVNLSIGGHTGPHDGTSAFDRAVDEMKSPGFVVVGAAGNEGEDKLHISHTFTANTIDTLFYTLVKFYNNNNKRDRIDLWSNDSKDIMMSVAVVENGNIVTQSKFISSDGNSHTESLKVGGVVVGIITVSPEINPHNQKHRLLLNLNASSQNGRNKYNFMLIVKSKNTKETASVKMWSNSNTFTSVGYTNNTNPVKDGVTSYTVGEIGGTANSIITVGSYTTKTQWKDINGKVWSYTFLTENDLSSFSSQGPTADGRIKPDITAPGAIIVSSYNSYNNNESSEDKVEEVTHNGRTFSFGTMIGTSMATPAVTGIIALWLQAHPTWQADSIKKYIGLTAINDSYTGNVRNNPSNLWGHGKIDAFNVLVMAPGDTSGIDPEEPEDPEEPKLKEFKTLAELVKQPFDNDTAYIYTGTATITMLQAEEGRKWIQDASGAIMVSDPEGKITTSYAIGDGISNISGKLKSADGFFSFIPEKNTVKGPASVVKAESISLSRLLNSGEMYQSKLITIKEVIFTDLAKFEPNKSYFLEKGNVKDSLLYTFFKDANYIGSALPDTYTTITGIVVFKNNKYYVAPRNLADIVVDSTGVANENGADFGGIEIYPNPSHGAFTVVVPEGINKANLELIDLSGRVIYRASISQNSIKIEGIQKGFYILKLKTENKLFTTKVNIL